MVISDIITLVSLVIAVVAILNEKNRKHMLLKFHIVDYILFGFAFVLINYFVFYDGFYGRDIYFSKFYFSNFGFRNPKNWAYIISISSLGYFFIKIQYFTTYPFSKFQKVLNYYQDLIENNETVFLLDLISRYHKKDIIKFIEDTKDYNPNTNWWERGFKKKRIKKKLREWYKAMIRFLIPFSKYNKELYAYLVLNKIINNPAFLALASNQRPYLFAEIFFHFREIKRNAFPNELINSFLKQLIQNKNFWLKKELKQSSKNDPSQPEGFYEDNKILGSIILDLSVADVNEVWRPFGQGAIAEIEEERTKGYESKMFHEYTDNEILWEYTTYCSIQFFYLIINEAINKQYTNSHFFLFYYDRITDNILKTFKKYPPEDFENHTTIYHKLIEEIVSRSFYWLEEANKKNHSGMFFNILDCIGTLIYQVCKSPYYGEKRKLSLLDSMFNYYCDLEENDHFKELRNKYEEIFLRPSMLTNEKHPYYLYISLAWEKFDKIPHRAMQGNGEDYEYFARLKERVIVPLELDPDEY